MKSNREWNFHQFWNSDGDEKILNNSNVAKRSVILYWNQEFMRLTELQSVILLKCCLLLIIMMIRKNENTLCA